MRLPLLMVLLCSPLCAADIYLSPTGSDTPGGGTLGAPFQTLAYAHTQSNHGDTLILRAGTYTGGVYMTRNNLTVQSYAGEWATIVLPNGTSGQDVTLYFAGSGCTARRLEIVGGYYYCVKIDAGPALVEDCRIHGSGRDCVKIPGADNVTIRRCEIYDSGLRDPSNAEGIDNVNGDTMLVQDCYIHDIATNGLYPKGGSIGSIIERCLIRNCGGKGISLAQSSDPAFYDTTANPEYYGCRDCIARNNIIENCEGSGIDLEAALRARVYNNTMINVAKSQNGGIRFASSTLSLPGGGSVTTPCRDCEIRNNIIVLGSASARPMLFMGNNSHAGTLTMSHNRYYKTGGAAVYWWEPTGQYGLNLAGWKGASGTDASSTEGDPQVGADWHLLGTSPCIDAGTTIAGFADDYDGNTRSGIFDIGADETGGTALPTPPPAGIIGTGATGASPAPPTIVTSPSLAAQVGVPYSVNIACTGGSGPYSWSLASGTLPPGLTLDTSSTAAAAALSGTPTTPGSYTFTVQVSGGGTDTQQFTFNVVQTPGPDSGGSAGGGCLSAEGTQPGLALALLALALALTRAFQRSLTPCPTRSR